MSCTRLALYLLAKSFVHQELVKQYHCLMLHDRPCSLPGSNYAIVDSETPVHIVFDKIFVTNEDHTSVAGFSGSSSRSTHRGDLNIRTPIDNNKYVTLFDRNSTLIVPDCVHRLYSVRQATMHGHTVIIDCHKPGIRLNSNPKRFIPFVLDPESKLRLLPLYPSLEQDNGIHALPKPANSKL